MLSRFFRNRFYLITTFPIALLAFWVIQITFFNGGFLPFMILLMLGVLAGAEYFADFEVNRANKILKTDIPLPNRPWYVTKFWSWDGVKERVSSARAWLSVAYVFVAIFFSAVAVLLVILCIVSLGVLVFALGVVDPNLSETSWNLIQDNTNGTLTLAIDNAQAVFSFVGVIDGESIPLTTITWYFTSGWTILAALFFVVLNLLLIPVLARHMSDVVANLLGRDSIADRVTDRVSQEITKRKSTSN